MFSLYETLISYIMRDAVAICPRPVRHDTHACLTCQGLCMTLPFRAVVCAQEYGGMAQYARWSAERRGADPAAAKAEDFYADAWAQSVFHNYMATLTSRINSITGTAYR